MSTLHRYPLNMLTLHSQSATEPNHSNTLNQQQNTPTSPATPSQPYGYTIQPPHTSYPSGQPLYSGERARQEPDSAYAHPTKVAGYTPQTNPPSGNPQHQTAPGYNASGNQGAGRAGPNHASNPSDGSNISFNSNRASGSSYESPLGNPQP